MQHPLHHENRSHSLMPEKRTSSPRQFGWVMTIFFALWAGYWTWTAHPAWPYLAAVALAFMALTMWAADWLAPLNRAWGWLGRMIARISDPVTLAVIFFGLVTPMAVAARMLGKDFLRLRMDRAAPSYWMGRQTQPGSMKKQF